MTSNDIITSFFALFSDLWMLAGLFIPAGRCEKIVGTASGFSNFTRRVSHQPGSYVLSEHFGKKVLLVEYFVLAELKRFQPPPSANVMEPFGHPFSSFGILQSIVSQSLRIWDDEKAHLLLAAVIWSQLTAWQRSILELITV